MSYVIDRNGNRKKVADNYVLQDGERQVMRAFNLIDGAPAPGGRITILDSAPGDKVAIGDAVATDTCGGLERIAFADGTSALRTPDGTYRYCGPNGQSGLALTLHQQAHQARVNGSTVRDFAVGYVDREATRNVAYDEMTQHLNDGWRGTGAARIADAATAHGAMVNDISNAWQAR